MTEFNGTLESPRERAYALRVEYEESESFEEKLEQLSQAVGADQIETLIIGCWSDEMYDCDSSLVVKALAARKERFPALKHLFLGEITYEESEISWIVQSDLSALLKVFPNLEWLTVRGGGSLEFSELEHTRLRGLVVEAGGLSAATIAQILAGRLPELEHLELWLGSDSYGGDSTVADLEALLSGTLFPKLRRLGLCNAEYTDEIVEAVAGSALLDRLTALDLSKGTLGDEGAEPLLSEHRFRRLELVDLSENFLTEERLREIAAILPRARADEQRSPSEYSGERYCSVSE